MNRNRKLRRQYARVYQSLGRAELQYNPPDQSLDLETLFEPTQGYWLDYYTKDGLVTALERYGFMNEVRALGYEELDVDIVVDEPDEQLFRLISRLPHLDEPLMEMVARRSLLNLSEELLTQLELPHLPVLGLEWMLLQNPLKDFSQERSPLPGQSATGLGLGRQVFELLRNVCHRLKLAGMVVVPSYLHNAIFYGQEFVYCDPRYEGIFDALKRDLIQARQNVSPQQALVDATWAARWGYLLEQAEDGTAHPFKWFHEPMLCGVKPHAKAFLDSDWYKAQRQHHAARRHFYLALEPLEERLEETGIRPYDEETYRTWLHSDPEHQS